MFDRGLFAAPGTPEAKALVAAMRSLTADQLPGADDYQALLPSIGATWVREVKGSRLWVYYGFSDEPPEVTLYSLSRVPPIALE
jgi:hypothetical protein